VFERWPTYDSALRPLRAAFELPTLALHGDLDPRIPNAEAERAAKPSSNLLSRLENFPFASHLLVGGTPINSGSGDCAFDLVHDFVLNKTGASCVADSFPPDFEGTEWAPTLFGSDSYWTD
jgi:pimeloyl-ACP methyl ester carboxylesterase